jgi:pyridoxamine 5'-phosphate oxidase
MALPDTRREYSLSGLDRDDLAADPLTQFTRWFGDASGRRRASRFRRIGIALVDVWHAVVGRPPVDVNAMVVATATPQGVPSARTVLLKGVDARGFMFFTNYDSRKGRELAENPRAALVFFWPGLQRQVTVSGDVRRLPAEESERYFRSRPWGSRIAAWASDQSAAVPNRAALEERWRETAARFSGNDVPLPPNWGGYVLDPLRIEFWQGRPNRLHDRFSYTRDGELGWRLERLAP